MNHVYKAQTPTQKKKIDQVMGEFKSGKLKSSSGDKVTDRSQAVAIAMNEAGVAKKAIEELIDEGLVDDIGIDTGLLGKIEKAVKQLVIKAGAPVGTKRQHKDGKTYVKQSDGKWTPMKEDKGSDAGDESKPSDLGSSSSKVSQMANLDDSKLEQHHDKIVDSLGKKGYDDEAAEVSSYIGEGEYDLARGKLDEVAEDMAIRASEEESENNEPSTAKAKQYDKETIKHMSSYIDPESETPEDLDKAKSQMRQILHKYDTDPEAKQKMVQSASELTDMNLNKLSESKRRAAVIESFVVEGSSSIQDAHNEHMNR